MGKSIVVAYILWAFGGWFGLHHFYLGRDKQAFVWWVLVAGYGGVGWIVDFFCIPRYVEEANFSPEYVQKYTTLMKKYPKPPFHMYRLLGQIAFGNLLAWLTYAAIPVEEVIPGVSLWWLISLVPLGSALGVYVVGNIGREEGSFRSTLIAAYLPFYFYTMPDPKYYWSSTLATLAFRSEVKWRRSPPKQRSVKKRIAILAACGMLYISLWGSYMYFNMVITNEHGETIKFRDSVSNLLKSPMFQELSDSLRTLFQYSKIHGWSAIWSEFLRKLDPMGERNALKTLDLPRGSSQEEITQKWRQLSRQWHPDKFRDPEEKIAAQTQFMKIKEAYDTLSVIHSRRKKRNSRSRASDRDASDSSEMPERVEL